MKNNKDKVSIAELAEANTHFLAKHAIEHGDAFAKVTAERLLDITQYQSIVTFSTDGYWSRGTTIPEAVRMLKKLGAANDARVGVYLILNDKDMSAAIDQYGYINASARCHYIYLGIVSTVSSVLKSNKNNN